MPSLYVGSSNVKWTMKSLLLKSLFIGVLFLTSSAWGGGSLCAQTYERMSEYEQKLYGQKAFVNADYESMVAIKRYWYEESLKLKNRRYRFSLTGSNDCVLKVTIAMSDLFNENDTVLLGSAENLIRPLVKYLRGRDPLAQVIIACHSDNNGSEAYLNRVTASRSRNLATSLIQMGVPPLNVYQYGHANRIPLNANRSVQQRRENRRVDLYLVPGKEMLRQARHGQIVAASATAAQTTVAAPAATPSNNTGKISITKSLNKNKANNSKDSKSKPSLFQNLFK